MAKTRKDPGPAGVRMPGGLVLRTVPEIPPDQPRFGHPATTLPASETVTVSGQVPACGSAAAAVILLGLIVNFFVAS